MISLPWETWVRLLVWFGIGLVVYFLYDYRYSALVERGVDAA